MLEIDGIESILGEHDRYTSGVLATRSVLRAVPFIEDVRNVTMPFSYWSRPEEGLFVALDAIRVATAFVALGKDGVVEGDIVENISPYNSAYTASDEAEDAEGFEGIDYVDVAFAAAHAVYASVSSYYSKDNRRVVNAAASGVATAITNYDPDSILTKEFLIDVDIVNAKGALYLNECSLWSSAEPKVWKEQVKYFFKIICDLDVSFDVWKAWYINRINGVAVKPYLSGCSVLLPPEIKRKGWQAANEFLDSYWNSNQCESDDKAAKLDKADGTQKKISVGEASLKTSSESLHAKWLETVSAAAIDTRWRVEVFTSECYSEFPIDKDNLRCRAAKVGDRVERAYSAIEEFNLEYVMAKVPVDDEGHTLEDKVIFKLWARNYPQLYVYQYNSIDLLVLQKDFPDTWLEELRESKGKHK